MAEKRIDMRIVCPFYIDTFRFVIRCSPINSARSTSSTFRSLEERNAYIDDFCASRCWQGCVIARACMKKYEEENGG